MMRDNYKKNYGEISQSINRQYSTAKIISLLQEIKIICRENKWYASASYASMAADSLFHMQSLGDKAQRPDFLVHLTDIHYSQYPDDDYDEEECD
jgi:hypothetical protein